jgi:hypothetical protein
VDNNMILHLIEPKDPTRRFRFNIHIWVDKENV